MSEWIDPLTMAWSYLAANILPAVLILAAGLVLIRLVMKLLKKLLEKSKLEKAAHKLIKAVARIAVK
jgi:uncharacterized membrane protein